MPDHDAASQAALPDLGHMQASHPCVLIMRRSCAATRHRPSACRRQPRHCGARAPHRRRPDPDITLASSSSASLSARFLPPLTPLRELLFPPHLAHPVGPPSHRASSLLTAKGVEPGPLFGSGPENHVPGPHFRQPPLNNTSLMQRRRV